MSRYSNLSVRAKIILITVIIMLFTIGSSTFICNRILIKEYKNALQSEAVAICLGLKLQLERLLNLGLGLDDIIGFEEQCKETVDKYDTVSYAMVTDLDGKIIFHNKKHYYGETIKDVSVSKTFGIKEKLFQHHIEKGEKYYEVSLPVFNENGNHVSAVRVGFPENLIIQKTTKLFAISIGITVIFIGLSIGLSIFAFTALVTRPLSDLLNVILDIRQHGVGGTGKRVSVKSDDEIGKLGSAFNHMIKELEESHKKEKRYTNELELRVKERTEELEKAKIAAESSNRTKSEFLANMSHELRTPLNHIIGFGEVLIDKHVGELNEEQSEFLSDMLHSSKHLLSLINDILDLSKVEAGKFNLELSEVDLKELLKGSLVMVKERALKRGIELKTIIDGLPNDVRLDERKIKQILYNLLSNSVKFTSFGGEVVLGARTINGAVRPGQEDEDTEKMSVFEHEADSQGYSGNLVRPCIEIWVSDTGIGIAKDHQDSIFNAFEQVEGSINSQFDGTGLGLSLTKKLVELHGGKIWVESEGEGKGSSFHFVIPALFV